MTEQQWLTSTAAAMYAFVRDRVTDEQREHMLVALASVPEAARTPDIRCQIICDIFGNPFRPMSFAVGPCGDARCPKCGNSFQNGVPADHHEMRRCATCKTVWTPLDPEWLKWQDGTIPKMVDEMLFEECDMPFGPGHPTCSKCGGKPIPRAEPLWQIMLVIADALESAGCAESAILEHLRSEWDGEWCAHCIGAGCAVPLCNGTGRIKRRHWRGCWVLELLRVNP